ncbi:MAG TPA: glycosyltransferase [Acidimicrobiales bacterium]|jgi:glycosyltransferase involved in cell wall biosynthesis|nr:glycosyltransferase [Acidimicrobiales bacterium]
MRPEPLEDEGGLDLTVVVPYFNPGDRVRQTIDELIETLRRTPASFEVIAVSDGSTDGSERSLSGLAPDLVRTIRLAENRGKGEALRVGFTMGRGRFLGFIDADGDLPPEQIAILAAFATATAGGPPDVVLGTKRHPESEVVYPPVRRLYSWLWQQAVLVLFQLQVRDTQTGLKLVRREVLAEVLPRMLEKRFAFDLELLVVARRLGYRRFVEVPVRIRQRFGSTVSVRAAAGMLLDLLAIFYRLHILHYYDRPPDDGSSRG